MSNPTPSHSATSIDPDDLDNNTSGNPSLHDVLAARLHRRHVLGGGIGAMTMAGFGAMGLAACACCCCHAGLYRCEQGQVGPRHGAGRLHRDGHLCHWRLH